MRSATNSFCAKETCLVSHRNAPLTPAGRLRLVQRCRYRPIAHVAAEAGVSRQCLSKWVNRYRHHGESGLVDRSSAAHRHPTQLEAEIIAEIAQLRRDKKWSARLIAVELAGRGHRVSTATVSRWLVRLGLNRRCWLDVDGEPLRQPQKIVARYRGHMVHLDVKKVGRIPDGGGWRVHGRGSTQQRAASRAKTRGARAGYVYLHSAVDGYSRLAYTEHLPDETATTAVGFWARARAWFAAHGITRITRVVTDNGSCYRSRAFARATSHAARHQRTRPYTPKHNGKVERYQRILAEELLYARPFTSEAERARAVQVWNIHYNYHRPHTAAGNQPPVQRLDLGVTNVMRSYT
jgi:transposase InsO family protein